MDDHADEHLVRAGRQGDKAAYALLVQKHYRHIFALCLGMLANVHDAEDVAQEAMLKGFQSIGRLTWADRFEPWILRIARNLLWLHGPGAAGGRARPRAQRLGHR